MNSMSWLRVAIIGFFLCYNNVSAQEQGKFVFATHTKPPLSQQLEAIYQAAFQHMGHVAEFVTLPGRRIVHAVNSGDIDGDASRLKSFKQLSTDKTDNYLLVDEPVLNIDLVVIVRKELDFSPVHWSKVNEGRVAYISGSMKIQKHVAIPNRKPLPEAIAVLEMVKRARVRSAILFKAVAVELFNKYPAFHKDLKIISTPIESFNLYPFLHKKHQNLKVPLQKALQAIKADGRYQAIIEGG
ncbi:amino acid ABC transporter substrate-binding protein, PAAT family [Colwellia chukchiensis]|uniref:Amino acid ABC transporter substrate-binding protein, PAAT family n=1 Tax=Colwellia chukchiensis TaxID=641665 RepID=A0A1H7PDN4_9GAMM|nr:transporter substrate-binding domain-containing protein [Colwellia chukchiensis]SEL33746.1 amino acid ABC transporter substrate-binding protein, PAAT family [Colwellia chukchiensis]